jgi:hypothetical protein
LLDSEETSFVGPKAAEPHARREAAETALAIIGPVQAE